MPKTYTVKQIAEILGFSTNSIYSFLKAKRIKGVRVGKGRFRIPETELARVLHLSKNTLPQQSEGTILGLAPARNPQKRIGDDRLVENRQSETVITGLWRKTWSLPNIFDWFVGLSAIVSGVGLFLFNQTYQAPQAAAFTMALPAIQIILIAAGFGVLISDILPKSREWHRFFLALLAAMGLYNVRILWGAGDVGATVVYGLLAILVGINVFVHLGGIFSLALYVTLLALATPVIFWLGTEDVLVRTLLAYVHLTPTLAVAIAGILSCVFLFLFWAGYRGARYLFWVGCWFGAGLLVAVALFHAQLVFWARSFFFLTLAFFTMFLPIWRSFQYSGTRQQRLIIHGVFAATGGLFILMLGVVRIMQMNVWEQNKQEFTNKLTYARTLVESSLESVESSLVAASTNPDLHKAMVSGNLETLTAIGKVLHESNSNIRRVVFLNAKGDGVALYPHGTFDQPNFAFRDYFIQARDRRKPYISDFFEALADNEQRKVMVVAVPLEDKKGEFLGVMAGSVDLLRINGKLQSVAVGSRGEHFLVVDSEGKIILALETTDVGTTTPETDLLRKGLSGMQGVELHKLRDGTLGMVAYAPLPRYKWALSLRVPASRVYALTQAATFSIFAIVGTLIVVALGFMTAMYIRVRWPPRKGSP